MGPRYNDYDMWDHMGGGGGSGWWIGLVMLIVALVAVALIVWVVIMATRGHGRSDGGHIAPPAAPPDARAILDRRLAMGEIDVDEYQRRKDALGGQVDPPSGSA